jgi:hypothetical protein
MQLCIAAATATPTRTNATMTGSAWYFSDRSSFLAESVPAIVGQLASNAAAEGLHIEAEQHDEWHSSVDILQAELADKIQRLEVLKESLRSPDLAEYRHVILEYDFRRRGLRIDCVLLGDGIIAIVEFKRTAGGAADRDQVTSYCLNLVEFHEETRRLTEQQGCIIVPVLAQTSGSIRRSRLTSDEFHRAPWTAVVKSPLECDKASMHRALRHALSLRRSTRPTDPQRWLQSRFAPSSTILDAAVSLYGRHDVSGIDAHAAPVELINRCTEEVAQLIERTQREGVNRIIFVSGAPGAGKTLVGLRLAFDQRFRDDAVFVTGNAPLVDVLTKTLKNAYRAQHRRSASPRVLSGYSREEAHHLIEMATFKIVKAHTFLGHRGRATGSADGRVVIFDEAQRTYQAGREVLRRRLEADEAELILQSLEESYGDGCTVVALIGHNQAINRGELGIGAWFTAAEKRGWRFAIGEETLSLSEGTESASWADHPLRDNITAAHLPHSLRFYRNSGIERWAGHVLEDQPSKAAAVAAELDQQGNTIWIVRELVAAKQWVASRRAGDERAGIIASAQGRRLAAEGLFVELKPAIADWMLAPSGDVRSSNMLETVQNQYQVQGLELDYTITGWDLDLRREGDHWASYKLSGAEWRKDKALGVAKNGYRVLLTRARKGMVLFVPRGSDEGDESRPARGYSAIAEYLIRCGARVPA